MPKPSNTTKQLAEPLPVQQVVYCAKKVMETTQKAADLNKPLVQVALSAVLQSTTCKM